MTLLLIEGVMGREEARAVVLVLLKLVSHTHTHTQRIRGESYTQRQAGFREVCCEATPGLSHKTSQQSVIRFIGFVITVCVCVYLAV